MYWEFLINFIYKLYLHKIYYLDINISKLTHLSLLFPRWSRFFACFRSRGPDHVGCVLRVLWKQRWSESWSSGARRWVCTWISIFWGTQSTPSTQSITARGSGVYPVFRRSTQSTQIGVTLPALPSC